jgi:hypothetical protein
MWKKINKLDLIDGMSACNGLATLRTSEFSDLLHFFSLWHINFPFKDMKQKLQSKSHKGNGNPGAVADIRPFTEMPDLDGSAGNRLPAHELFGLFTEEVIKKRKRFVR